MSCSPFMAFREECSALLERALAGEGISTSPEERRLVMPSDPALGDMSYSTFNLAKKARSDPRSIASKLATRANSLSRRLVEKVEAAGGGYVNFYIDAARFAGATLSLVMESGKDYGVAKSSGERVMVEHTSVNPIHPIHIGGARNAIIGDCLSRIMKAAGKEVLRHYYIDDVGLQVAQASYGFSKLGNIPVNGKSDQFIGFIYATTSCAMNIKTLRAEIENLKKEGKDDQTLGKMKEIDDWVSAAKDLKEKNGVVFDRVFDAIFGMEDPGSEIAMLLQKYEGQDPDAVALIRKLCELAIAGFKETLGRVGVEFDSWDWESELASWSGGAFQVVDMLSKTDFTRVEEGTTILDTEEVACKYGLKDKYGIKQEIPPLTLKRSDGTTLYTTRDIAYTLWKFERAESVINVISIEQKLPQLQLKLALYALGRSDLAERLTHFSYELVHLPGFKMSGRRGRYIAFDDVLDEAVERAYKEVSEKSPNLSDEEKRGISELVGIGAVRFALISVASHKPITFTWDRVLNFEQNSAPFIQYSHARASNILAKVGGGSRSQKAAYDALTSKYEKALMVRLGTFPDRVQEAAQNLRPEEIAECANDLASAFNLFYDNIPVLKTEDLDVREARLRLVEGTKIVLANALAMLGIVAPSRM